MQQIIQNVLQQIENDHQVKILYACEAGSRAWGLASQQSDYDVRFIYVHQTEDYLSIDPIGIGKNKNIIELPVNETLDITGWDLTKALQLFRKSNPTIMEWLYSSIVYHEEFSTIRKMKAMQTTVFSPAACIHHYLNITRKNRQKYTKQQQMTVKNTLAMLRPMLAAKWTERFNEFPPTEFSTLIRMVDDPQIIKTINTLIEHKQSQKNEIQTISLDEILPFISRETEHLVKYVKTLHVNNSDSTNQLNQLFRDTLMEVWN